MMPPSPRPQRCTVVVGTRPEAIKLAPLVRVLKAHPQIEPRLLASGQHRQLATSALAEFDLTADQDLGVMQHRQDLAGLTARILQGCATVFTQERPDAVIVQGDTTTALAGALAAFYQQIPVYHIEAGLRSYRLDSPFPEEANRGIISRLAQLHFAPTPSARDALLREGIADTSIHVTGNTGIDALRLMQARLSATFPGEVALPDGTQDAVAGRAPFLLVTAHRRETLGDGIQQLSRALAMLATEHPTLHILFPLHPNPQIEAPLRRALDGHKNIHLLPPLSYAQCIWLMQRCHFLITDSGGLQEEAATLGKPLLVTRNVTERGEALREESQLTGTDTSAIITIAKRLLTDTDFYRRASCNHTPFGDGNAATRIATIIARHAGRVASQRIAS